MPYDADVVTQEYWKPALDDIASKLPDEKADTGAGLRGVGK
jgi:hypothetical protein